MHYIHNQKIKIKICLPLPGFPSCVYFQLASCSVIKKRLALNHNGSVKRLCSAAKLTAVIIKLFCSLKLNQRGREETTAHLCVSNALLKFTKAISFSCPSLKSQSYNKNTLTYKRKPVSFQNVKMHSIYCIIVTNAFSKKIRHSQTKINSF